MATSKETYNASSIDVVQNIAHVRKRPGMYIVDTGTAGATQLLKECLDNAIDEWLAGHVTIIKVRLIDKLTFEVRDNGRGIPVDMHPKTKKPALTTIFTLLGAGGKFSKKSYEISSGLHGVGLTVVNALSSNISVWSKRDNRVWKQSFAQGKVKTKLVPHKRKLAKGTIIRAQIDTEIFKKVEYKDAAIAHILRTTAFLCPGLKIDFTDTKGNTTRFEEHYGLHGLICHKHGDSFDIGPIIVQSDYIDAAIGWRFSHEGETWHSYCNVSPTPDGGSHVNGAQLAVSTALQKWSKGSGLTGRDLRDGLIACVHVLEPDPTFSSQSKFRLTGDGVKTRSREEVFVQVQKWFSKNAKSAREIIVRAKQLKAAKSEYRKARGLMNKINKTSRGTLPNKLEQSPHCATSRRELFLVEGDSAGGSATRARDPKFQEVLPLRGKMPNSARTTMSKLLENEEMQNILRSIGGGFGPDFRESNIRVGKVLLLMDADPDGHHLVSLLLVFFLQYMRGLVKSGRLFVVDSPLFVGEHGDKRWFGNTIEYVKKHPKAIISRLKGHGSSTVKDLRTYAFDITKRKLIKVTPKMADRALAIMGDQVEVRKELLGLVNNGA